MTSAVAAWVVGANSSEYDYATFDKVVGYSGIAASTFALFAFVRSGWARIPLACVLVIAGLMAYARLGPPSDGIDLTPIYFPPMVFLFGAIALFLVALSPQRDQ